MQGSNRHIITTAITLGCISAIYFMSLVLHVPFVVTVLLIAVGVYFLHRQAVTDRDQQHSSVTARPLISIIILATGLALTIYNSYPLAPKYGEWDAWSMWNLHAKYLADGNSWHNLFLNKFADHTDYPLLLPGINGFFLRLTPRNMSLLVPFLFSFMFMLFIPVLIYTELAGRNLVVAALTLLLFATDTYFLKEGTWQYADTILAFFLLATLVCTDHAAANKKNIALAAACLGCCIWTKNEGVILASVFMAFHTRLFLSKENIRYTLVGLALFLVVFITFKVFYAPPNDMVEGQNKTTYSQLFIGLRYELIYNRFMYNLRTNFTYTKFAFLLYPLLCIAKREWPGRQFLMILSCAIIYIFVYVLSVQDLAWHLITSQDRLMLQLMPALIYVIAKSAAGTRLLTFKKKAL